MPANLSFEQMCCRRQMGCCCWWCLRWIDRWILARTYVVLSRIRWVHSCLSTLYKCDWSMNANASLDAPPVKVCRTHCFLLLSFESRFHTTSCISLSDSFSTSSVVRFLICFLRRCAFPSFLCGFWMVVKIWAAL